MNETYEPKFSEFLRNIETTEFETNTTATGALTIQQSIRNELRKQGLTALKADLEWLYGKEFDVVETKDGIVLVAENEPGDFTFSWELKNTIKSLDYDPFIQASNFEEATAEKAEKKARIEAEKAERARKLSEKRAKKLAELEAKKNYIRKIYLMIRKKFPCGTFFVILKIMVVYTNLI